MSFGIDIQATDGAARAGILRTGHGDVQTPVFMPVGTAGTVKAMTSDQVRATGAGLVLGNTYHLMLRPGADRVEVLGGLHRFMDWAGPILTDSGGFQVMSLAGLRTLDEDGVTFRSHLDGSAHRLTPESATRIQHQLDATITMALDECTPFPATPEQVRSSMALSMRWAARSRAAFVARPGYGQFGIVQGGTDPAARAESVAALLAIGFEGYAVGGLAVGEGQDAMLATLEATVPLLPADRPRYLMGVGTPGDLVAAVLRGVDMFDCVMPTRAGRTARAFTSRGVLNLRNARHAPDPAPLDPACTCTACTRHSRAYLHHLFRADEMLGPMLLTQHNLTYYQSLMQGMRTAIVERRAAGHAAAVRAGWRSQGSSGQRACEGVVRIPGDTAVGWAQGWWWAATIRACAWGRGWGPACGRAVWFGWGPGGWLRGGGARGFGRGFADEGWRRWDAAPGRGRWRRWRGRRPWRLRGGRCGGGRRGRGRGRHSGSR